MLNRKSVRRALLPAAVHCLMILALLVCFGGTACAQQPQTTAPRTITVMGDAEVRVAPDLAQVSIGIVSEAATAAEARGQNAELAQRVVQAIRGLGVPEADVRTSLFSLEPIRRFDQPERRGEPPIVGYRVTNIVTVRTGDFDLVPRIIDESIRAGANRVEGVVFTLRDDRDASRRALRQAVAEARANARAIASELGVRIVRVHSVQQGGIGFAPPPVLFRSAVAAEGGPATPIQPGQVTVNATVTVAYVIQ